MAIGINDNEPTLRERNANKRIRELPPPSLDRPGISGCAMLPLFDVGLFAQAFALAN